eukprot:TRINITY_DN409_c0_g1_i5.p1 TRINITY_DN409_c0_g1~~TRINITY_DN409_c0_g1_i5.p1  ORF type:complete len:192 (+),score=25.12 TRINITY_DN409_c0_g1_i5:97-672(+)
MLVPRKNLLAIYAYLFQEGVLVAKKDFGCKHGDIEVPNIQVIKVMQSLVSREYVKDLFSWQWHYYTLTNKGMEYLRDFLHAGDSVPATLKPKRREASGPRDERDGGGRGRGGRGRGRGRGGFGGDRDDYRGPKDGAPRGFDPDFEGGSRGRGGFGRGGFGRGGRGRGGRGRGGRGGGFGGGGFGGSDAAAE